VSVVSRPNLGGLCRCCGEASVREIAADGGFRDISPRFIGHHGWTSRESVSVFRSMISLEIV
jgi:hypothetical protein